MILRDEIIDVVRREIIGPSTTDNIEMQNETLREMPLLKYISGILEPHQNELGGSLEPSDALNDEIDGTVEDEDVKGFRAATGTSQSSMGFSFFIGSSYEKPLKIQVSYGTYKRLKDDSFQRQQHIKEFTVDISSVNLGLPFRQNFHENKLSVLLIERDPSNRFFDSSNKRLFTLSLRNLLKNESSRRPSFDECFYQAYFSVETYVNEPILAYPDYDVLQSEDDLNNQLLYSEVRNYAVGHGCSVIWDTTINKVTRLESTFLPTYELFPLNHREFFSIDLSMLALSSDKNGAFTIKVLGELAEQYENWINSNERKIDDIKNGKLVTHAKQNIANCRHALERLKAGAQILENNPLAREGFRQMNWTMLFQQIRYSLGERLWKRVGSELSIESISLPIVEDPRSWPDYDNITGKNLRLGKWRPFQIAFVVMNLNSLIDDHSPERDTVDLIWFPTGGGKTEAYLGLTAFTIIYNRLANKKSEGTDVLMRYTLRLLTTEQFQRAASLICACELIRRGKPELGRSPFTIGLWVGSEVTPNRNAVKVLQEMIQLDRPYNFVLLKCPCCGKKMGKVSNNGELQVKGLRVVNDNVEFTCYSDCEFSGIKLPIEVVDECIYENPPTVLVATVDKFALLPWEPRSRRLLGLDVPTVGKVSPLSLIIQDELHLISGPLGSLVGLYETLIEYLISKVEDEDYVRPKIIASTATIALAKQQIQSLYNRYGHKICVFPSPCLKHDDNFFAFQDESDKGRKYIGVFANSSPSFKTTQVRLMSILLQAPFLFKSTNGEDIDPYYTLVAYFNTIKDLGYAVTFCDDDIPKRLKELHFQYSLSRESAQRRYLNNYEELTSRKDNEDVPAIRQKLSNHYPDKNSLDACLATNMISVGIDIPRISLMCMIAQPKSTAEYIQASSRVGRDKRKPGLVFMAYNSRRSRDRSYFERFFSYHTRLYTFVEPSGVTPFSLPTVERGLPGIIVGMLRLKEKIGGDVNSIVFPENSTIDKIKSYILDRCHQIDPLEVQRTSSYFDLLMKRWRNLNPSFYGEYFPDVNGRAPLMIPYSFEGQIQWGNEPWRVLTSLRNVDKETVLKQIKTFIK
jgi:hypothetical protein